MNLVSVDPRVDPLWLTLVQQTQSSVFHSPAWITAVTETYGWGATAHVVVDAGGAPLAGIAFCRISDLFGKRIVALPFSDYCDPLVSDVDAWDLLADELLRERCPILTRCLHNNLPLADTRFAVVKQAKWHGIDLTPGLDALWQGMHASSRQAIRKAEREGVVVRVAQSEQELRAFFDMHLHVRKYKYGLLAQPFRFFQNLWRHFMEAQHGFLLLGVHQDQIVAGEFFLEWKDTLYYKFNASNPNGLAHRPNDLLTWTGIQHAVARGRTFLDFGLCDWEQEGLARYKRKFGSQEGTISFLQHDPQGSRPPLERELRSLVTQITRRFTEQSVPDALTEKAGEDFYRLFT